MLQRAGEVGLGLFGAGSDLAGLFRRERVGDLRDFAGEAIETEVVALLQAIPEGGVAALTPFSPRRHPGERGGENAPGEFGARGRGRFVDALSRSAVQRRVVGVVGASLDRRELFEGRSQFGPGDFELFCELLAVSGGHGLGGGSDDAGKSVAEAFEKVFEFALHRPCGSSRKDPGEVPLERGAALFESGGMLRPLWGAAFEGGRGIGGGAQGVELSGENTINGGEFAPDRGEGGPLLQTGGSEEGGAVELLRWCELLVGEQHRVGVVDENGDLARDFALLDEGAHRLDEDQEEDDERREPQGDEEAAASRRDEGLFEAIDPDDGLGGETAEEGDGEQGPGGGEGEEVAEELEGEPGGARRAQETQGGEGDGETGMAPPQFHRGKPEQRADEEAATRENRAEGFDQVGAAEVVGVHGRRVQRLR